MKRVFSLMIAFAMLLTLAACGGDDTAVSDVAEAAPNVVEMLDTDWYKDTPAQPGDVTQLPERAVYVELSNAADEKAGITVTNDIVYYEAGRDFTYGEGSAEDEHSAEEAAEHTVVTITKAGTYVLSGTLGRGQIAVDLGKDAKEDPNAVVTLVLNGVDVTCTVAPAVIFYNVYECGSDDVDTASYKVDTSAAGANVVIPDGSINQVRGSYVARIYKSVELSDDGKEVVASKKLHKYDAAFYSKMSMNINGGADNSGVLNIVAENEGLDSELHLTMNGGYVVINAGNDGINTNEDGVSVTTVNGGTLDIRCTGSTGEGDGIDSNGWLVINGGRVYAQACATSMDSGIDSDMGIYLNGGTVIASGNMLDRITGGSATYAVFSFREALKAGQHVYLKDMDGNLFMHSYMRNGGNNLIFAVDGMAAGDYTLWVDDVQMAHGGSMMGGMGFGGGRPNMGGFDPSQMQNFDPSKLEGMERPEGFDRGQMGGMEMPEGFDRSQMGGMEMPEGLDRSQMGDMKIPNDFDFGIVGGMPEGMELPEGMEMPQGGMDFGGRGQNGVSGELSEVFTIAEGGNRFSGITKYVPAE